MGNKREFEARNGRKMGNETEFETSTGRKLKTRQDTSFLNKKQEKQGKNRENRGGNTKRNRKKTDNRKKYRNKILTRFWKMLKTETRF